VNDWLASLAGEGALEPIPRIGEDGVLRSGSGRRNMLAEEVPVTGIVERMASALGTDYLRVALAVGGPMEIRSVAVCAGAGASALRGAEADVWVTGEMSHHDVLAATAAGVHVILSEHTRTERGYLPVLKERMESAAGRGLRVMVSKADRCPLTLVPTR
jgi:putative NIF3 family GTP cyclohydrolase 1 type 2